MRAHPRLHIILISIALACAARAQPQPVDPTKSTVTVHVFKAGVFSAFGHDHMIGAPVSAGTVDPSARRVEIRFHAADLRVRDIKGSENDRAEIQKTMLGPDVLDVGQFTEIAFRSNSVESAGPGSWTVHGTLALHGQTKPVTVSVNEKDGHYVGRALLKQTDFGIQPVRIAGGAVRVKDNVQIDFDIQVGQGRARP